MRSTLCDRSYLASILSIDSEVGGDLHGRNDSLRYIDK